VEEAEAVVVALMPPFLLTLRGVRSWMWGRNFSKSFFSSLSWVFVLDLAFGFWVRCGDLVLGQNKFMRCLRERGEGGVYFPGGEIRE
jgi:hypothetical protein